MDQNISAFKAPTLAPHACREYMSDGHTTLGDWAAYVTNFAHTHEYLTAFIGAVILTGLSLAYVYAEKKKKKKRDLPDETYLDRQAGYHAHNAKNDDAQARH